MCSGFDSEEDKINNGIDIYKHIGEQMKKLIKENENYKKRINKASSFIKHNGCYDKDVGGLTHVINLWELEFLLSLLEGDK